MSADPTAAGSTIAVTVVGGYLGAGKTTLVNHVLTTADERLAVLVNDFGELNIDADLIASHDGDTLELANGCICCSLVDGFASALDTIGSLSPKPGRLLIEASGVADPSSVAAYAHAPGFALDAVVVVADASSIEDDSADRYVGDAVLGQLDAADLVVLNKVDLVGPAEADRVAAWLADRAPSAAVVRATRAAVEPMVLFGPTGSETELVDDRDGTGRHGAVRPHLDVETWSIRLTEAVRAEVVEAAMAAVPPGVIRLKGILHLAGEATPAVLQRVGRRWSLQPAAPDVAARTRTDSEVVAIGRPGAIDDGWLAAHFDPGDDADRGETRETPGPA